jgi:hypothetical protein
MPNEPTDMHGPSTSARVQSNQVAHCQVCHVQWQVIGDKRDNAHGCAFCGSPESAITIENESPTYGGAQVV